MIFVIWDSTFDHECVYIGSSMYVCMYQCSHHDSALYVNAFLGWSEKPQRKLRHWLHTMNQQVTWWDLYMSCVYSFPSMGQLGNGIFTPLDTNGFGYISITIIYPYLPTLGYHSLVLFLKDVPKWMLVGGFCSRPFPK